MFEVLPDVAGLVGDRPDAVPCDLLQVLERLGRLQPIQPGQHVAAVGGSAWNINNNFLVTNPPQISVGVFSSPFLSVAITFPVEIYSIN